MTEVFQVGDTVKYKGRMGLGDKEGIVKEIFEGRLGGTIVVDFNDPEKPDGTIVFNMMIEKIPPEHIEAWKKRLSEEIL